jgi:hypothetical protein
MQNQNRDEVQVEFKRQLQLALFRHANNTSVEGELVRVPDGPVLKRDTDGDGRAIPIDPLEAGAAQKLASLDMQALGNTADVVVNEQNRRPVRPRAVGTRRNVLCDPLVNAPAAGPAAAPMPRFEDKLLNILALHSGSRVYLDMLIGNTGETQEMFVIFDKRFPGDYEVLVSRATPLEQGPQNALTQLAQATKNHAQTATILSELGLVEQFGRNKLPTSLLMSRLRCTAVENAAKHILKGHAHPVHEALVDTILGAAGTTGVGKDELAWIQKLSDGDQNAAAELVRATLDWERRTIDDARFAEACDECISSMVSLLSYEERFVPLLLLSCLYDRLSDSPPADRTSAQLQANALLVFLGVRVVDDSELPDTHLVRKLCSRVDSDLESLQEFIGSRTGRDALELQVPLRNLADRVDQGSPAGINANQSGQARTAPMTWKSDAYALEMALSAYSEAHSFASNRLLTDRAIMPQTVYDAVLRKQLCVALREIQKQVDLLYHDVDGLIGPVGMRLKNLAQTIHHVFEPVTAHVRENTFLAAELGGTAATAPAFVETQPPSLETAVAVRPDTPAKPKESTSPAEALATGLKSLAQTAFGGDWNFDLWKLKSNILGFTGSNTVLTFLKQAVNDVDKALTIFTQQAQSGTRNTPQLELLTPEQTSVAPKTLKTRPVEPVPALQPPLLPAGTRDSLNKYTGSRSSAPVPSNLPPRVKAQQLQLGVPQQLAPFARRGERVERAVRRAQHAWTFELPDNPLRNAATSPNVDNSLRAGRCILSRLRNMVSTTTSVVSGMAAALLQAGSASQISRYAIPATVCIGLLGIATHRSVGGFTGMRRLVSVALVWNPETATCNFDIRNAVGGFLGEHLRDGVSVCDVMVPAQGNGRGAHRIASDLFLGLQEQMGIESVSERQEVEDIFELEAGRQQFNSEVGGMYFHNHGMCFLGDTGELVLFDPTSSLSPIGAWRTAIAGRTLFCVNVPSHIVSFYAGSSWQFREQFARNMQHRLSMAQARSQSLTFRAREFVADLWDSAAHFRQIQIQCDTGALATSAGHAARGEGAVLTLLPQGTSNYQLLGDAEQTVLHAFTGNYKDRLGLLLTLDVIPVVTNGRVKAIEGGDGSVKLISTSWVGPTEYQYWLKELSRFALRVGGQFAYVDVAMQKLQSLPPPESTPSRTSVFVEDTSKKARVLASVAMDAFKSLALWMVTESSAESPLPEKLLLPVEPHRLWFQTLADTGSAPGDDETQLEAAVGALSEAAQIQRAKPPEPPPAPPLLTDISFMANALFADAAALRRSCARRVHALAARVDAERTAVAAVAALHAAGPERVLPEYSCRALRGAHAPWVDGAPRAATRLGGRALDALHVALGVQPSAGCRFGAEAVRALAEQPSSEVQVPLPQGGAGLATQTQAFGAPLETGAIAVESIYDVAMGFAALVDDSRVHLVVATLLGVKAILSTRSNAPGLFGDRQPAQAHAAMLLKMLQKRGAARPDTATPAHVDEVDRRRQQLSRRFKTDVVGLSGTLALGMYLWDRLRVGQQYEASPALSASAIETAAIGVYGAVLECCAQALFAERAGADQVDADTVYATLRTLGRGEVASPRAREHLRLAGSIALGASVGVAAAADQVFGAPSPSRAFVLAAANVVAGISVRAQLAAMEPARAAAFSVPLAMADFVLKVLNAAPAAQTARAVGVNGALQRIAENVNPGIGRVPLATLKHSLMRTDIDQFAVARVPALVKLTAVGVLATPHLAPPPKSAKETPAAQRVSLSSLRQILARLGAFVDDAAPLTFAALCGAPAAAAMLTAAAESLADGAPQRAAQAVARNAGSASLTGFASVASNVTAQMARGRSVAFALSMLEAATLRTALSGDSAFERALVQVGLATMPTLEDERPAAALSLQAAKLEKPRYASAALLAAAQERVDGQIECCKHLPRQPYLRKRVMTDGRVHLERLRRAWQRERGAPYEQALYNTLRLGEDASPLQALQLHHPDDLDRGMLLAQLAACTSDVQLSRSSDARALLSALNGAARARHHGSASEAPQETLQRLGGTVSGTSTPVAVLVGARDALRRQPALLSACAALQRALARERWLRGKPLLDASSGATMRAVVALLDDCFAVLDRRGGDGDTIEAASAGSVASQHVLKYAERAVPGAVRANGLASVNTAVGRALRGARDGLVSLAGKDASDAAVGADAAGKAAPPRVLAEPQSDTLAQVVKLAMGDAWSVQQYGGAAFAELSALDSFMPPTLLEQLPRASALLSALKETSSKAEPASVSFGAASTATVTQTTPASKAPKELVLRLRAPPPPVAPAPNPLAGAAEELARAAQRLRNTLRRDASKDGFRYAAARVVRAVASTRSLAGELQQYVSPMAGTQRQLVFAKGRDGVFSSWVANRASFKEPPRGRTSKDASGASSIGALFGRRPPDPVPLPRLLARGASGLNQQATGFVDLSVPPGRIGSELGGHAARDIYGVTFPTDVAADLGRPVAELMLKHIPNAAAITNNVGIRQTLDDEAFRFTLREHVGNNWLTKDTRLLYGDGTRVNDADRDELLLKLMEEARQLDYNGRDVPKVWQLSQSSSASTKQLALPPTFAIRAVLTSALRLFDGLRASAPFFGQGKLEPLGVRSAHRAETPRVELLKNAAVAALNQINADDATIEIFGTDEDPQTLRLHVRLDENITTQLQQPCYDVPELQEAVERRVAIAAALGRAVALFAAASLDTLSVAVTNENTRTQLDAGGVMEMLHRLLSDFEYIEDENNPATIYSPDFSVVFKNCAIAPLLRLDPRWENQRSRWENQRSVQVLPVERIPNNVLSMWDRNFATAAEADRFLATGALSLTRSSIRKSVYVDEVEGGDDAWRSVFEGSPSNILFTGDESADDADVLQYAIAAETAKRLLRELASAYRETPEFKPNDRGSAKSDEDGTNAPDTFFKGLSRDVAAVRRLLKGPPATFDNQPEARVQLQRCAAIIAELRSVSRGHQLGWSQEMMLLNLSTEEETTLSNVIEDSGVVYTLAWAELIATDADDGLLEAEVGNFAAEGSVLYQTIAWLGAKVTRAAFEALLLQVATWVHQKLRQEKVINFIASNLKYVASAALASPENAAQWLVDFMLQIFRGNLLNAFLGNAPGVVRLLTANAAIGQVQEASRAMPVVPFRSEVRRNWITTTMNAALQRPKTGAIAAVVLAAYAGGTTLAAYTNYANAPASVAVSPAAGGGPGSSTYEYASSLHAGSSSVRPTAETIDDAGKEQLQQARRISDDQYYSLRAPVDAGGVEHLVAVTLGSDAKVLKWALGWAENTDRPLLSAGNSATTTGKLFCDAADTLATAATDMILDLVYKLPNGFNPGDTEGRIYVQRVERALDLLGTNTNLRVAFNVMVNILRDASLSPEERVDKLENEEISISKAFLSKGPSYKSEWGQFYDENMEATRYLLDLFWGTVRNTRLRPIAETLETGTSFFRAVFADHSAAHKFAGRDNSREVLKAHIHCMFQGSGFFTSNSIHSEHGRAMQDLRKLVLAHKVANSTSSYTLFEHPRLFAAMSSFSLTESNFISSTEWSSPNFVPRVRDWFTLASGQSWLPLLKAPTATYADVCSNTGGHDVRGMASGLSVGAVQAAALVGTLVHSLKSSPRTWAPGGLGIRVPGTTIEFANIVNPVLHLVVSRIAYVETFVFTTSYFHRNLYGDHWLSRMACFLAAAWTSSFVYSVYEKFTREVRNRLNEKLGKRHHDMARSFRDVWSFAKKTGLFELLNPESSTQPRDKLKLLVHTRAFSNALITVASGRVRALALNLGEFGADDDKYDRWLRQFKMRSTALRDARTRGAQVLTASGLRNALEGVRREEVAWDGGAFRRSGGAELVVASELETMLCANSLVESEALMRENPRTNQEQAIQLVDSLTKVTGGLAAVVLGASGSGVTANALYRASQLSLAETTAIEGARTAYFVATPEPVESTVEVRKDDYEELYGALEFLGDSAVVANNATAHIRINNETAILSKFLVERMCHVDRALQTTPVQDKKLADSALSTRFDTAPGDSGTDSARTFASRTLWQLGFKVGNKFIIDHHIVQFCILSSVLVDAVGNDHPDTAKALVFRFINLLASSGQSGSKATASALRRASAIEQGCTVRATFEEASADKYDLFNDPTFELVAVLSQADLNGLPADSADKLILQRNNALGIFTELLSKSVVGTRTMKAEQKQPNDPATFLYFRTSHNVLLSTAALPRAPLVFHDEVGGQPFRRSDFYTWVHRAAALAPGAIAGVAAGRTLATTLAPPDPVNPPPSE